MRLYDLHMRGAIKRLEREAEARNRQAYNTAALSGGAFGGNLPDYDQVFRGIEHSVEQSDEVLSANIRLWAAQFGVVTAIN